MPQTKHGIICDIYNEFYREASTKMKTEEQIPFEHLNKEHEKPIDYTQLRNREDFLARKESVKPSRDTHYRIGWDSFLFSLLDHDFDIVLHDIYEPWIQRRFENHEKKQEEHHIIAYQKNTGVLVVAHSYKSYDGNLTLSGGSAYLQAKLRNPEKKDRKFLSGYTGGYDRINGDLVLSCSYDVRERLFDHLKAVKKDHLFLTTWINQERSVWLSNYQDEQVVGRNKTPDESCAWAKPTFDRLRNNEITGPFFEDYLQSNPRVGGYDLVNLERMSRLPLFVQKRIGLYGWITNFIEDRKANKLY